MHIGARLYRNRHIIWQLTKRDVLLKYRGAYLGIAWAFFYPLLLLAAFTLVFGQILRPRWSQDGGSAPFALSLYCGLVVFGLFSEVISRAPAVIRGYPSYVKKIIFPLETLPLVLVATAVIHGAVNVLILLAGLTLFGKIHLTALLAPVALLPVVLLALGVGWFVAAWGVFLRDLTNITPVVVQILLFLCPVFYPLSAVPDNLRGLYLLNPLSISIEDLRRTLLEGTMPDWKAWLAASAISLVLAFAGYAFFQRTRDEFADVI